MTNKLILILLILNSLNCIGQISDIDSSIKLYISKLTAQGIDTIGYTKHFCESMSHNKCGNSTTYIFWVSNKQEFVRRINKCKVTKSKKVTNSIFFSNYFNDRKTIKNEQVKHFVLENGSWSNIDHYCGRVIVVYDGKDTINKKINYYHLSKGEENQKNINFQSNNELKLVEWDTKTNELIKIMFNKKKR